jgi:hypothetical protein
MDMDEAASAGEEEEEEEEDMSRSVELRALVPATPSGGRAKPADTEKDVRAEEGEETDKDEDIHK